VIKTWIIDYQQKFGKTLVPTTSGIDGPDTAEEAKAEFLRKNPNVKAKDITSVKAGTSQCETYEELVDWLKSREVSPREAQGGVQVMVLNSREPRKPWHCEKCGYDLNDGVDHVGNAYYCPKCHDVFQVG
jgi:predicted Zn-ribbon and HTH transcriptional regulator